MLVLVVLLLPFKSMARCRLLSKHYSKLLSGDSLMTARCALSVSSSSSCSTLTKMPWLAFHARASEKYRVVDGFCSRSACFILLRRGTKTIRWWQPLPMKKKLIISRLLRSSGETSEEKKKHISRGSSQQQPEKAPHIPDGKQRQKAYGGEVNIGKQEFTLIFDLSSKRWMNPTLQLPYLGPDCGLAAAHKLMFSIPSDDDKKELVVVDPTTSTSHILPAISSWDTIDASCFSGEGNWGFKVVAIGRKHEDDYYSVAQLASGDFVWQIFSTKIPTTFTVAHSNLALAVEDGSYFCIVHDVNGALSYKPFLLKLSMNRQWRITDAPDHPENHNFHDYSLLSCAGNRMFFIVCTYNNTELHKGIDEVVVWEMDVTTHYFRRITDMPFQYLRQIRVVTAVSKLLNRMQCLGHNDFIFFKYSDHRHFILYDIQNDRWESSPAMQHHLLSFSFCWDPV